MSRDDVPGWPMRLAVMVAFPGLLYAAVVAVLLVMELVGLSILAADSVTLSEAAALGDEGNIVRLIRRGVEPNDAARVRSHVLGGDELSLTPLEAAIATDRPRIVELLLDAGAVIDERNYPVIRCLAQRKNALEIVVFLEARRITPVTPDCSKVRAPW